MEHELRLIRAAAARHHLLGRDDVRRLGVTDDRWRRLVDQEVWVEVVPGVWRHVATPATWELQVRAGAQWLGRNAGLHAGSSLRWQGVEGCDDERVAFLVPRSRRHVPPWLELHTTTRWSNGDLLRIDGVPCMSATRAIVDLAASARPRAIEQAIDSAIRMRLTSVPTLALRLDALSGPGRHGTTLLRTLLLDSGGESTLERAFLRLLRRHGLPRPASQITYRTGERAAIRVDFEYVDRRLVIEVSGRKGHSSDSDRQHDARRRNELTRRGRTVIEFTTADVLEDPDYVVRTVADRLRHGSTVESTVEP